MIPRDRPLRIVGDVHGDARAFAHATATDHFIIQLGDLVDHGPNSAGVLKTMFSLIAAGNGVFLLGNHDLKLARALAGHQVRIDPPLQATLDQLDADLRTRAQAAIATAPCWLWTDKKFFVHGGFHDRMLAAPSPVGITRPDGLLARALYGQPTGRIQTDGYPERSLAWVERIPAGLTVYCGHDNRSTDGRPAVRRNNQGGTAIFLDTGAGKGGHLSWIDLPAGLTFRRD